MAACESFTPCVVPYFKAGLFLFDQQMWAFSSWYNSYVTYLFTQDPWFSLAVVVLWKMLKWSLIIFTVWVGDSNLSTLFQWEPGSDWMDIMLAGFGIAMAIMTTFVARSPKFICAPLQEIQMMADIYGVTEIHSACLNSHSTIYQHFKDFWMVRWKYYVELFSIQYFPPLVFYFVSRDLNGSSEIQSPRLFRIDWTLFLIIQTAIVILLFLLNWYNIMEKTILWKSNRSHYTIFYTIWLCSLWALLLPSVYFFYHPRIMILIGNWVLFLFLFMLLYWSLLNSKYGIITSFYQLINQIPFVSPIERYLQ